MMVFRGSGWAVLSCSDGKGASLCVAVIRALDSTHPVYGWVQLEKAPRFLASVCAVRCLLGDFVCDGLWHQ